jgi:hypothetical protein
MGKENGSQTAATASENDFAVHDFVKLSALTETPLQIGSHRQALQTLKNDFAVYDFLKLPALIEALLQLGSHRQALQPPRK